MPSKRTRKMTVRPLALACLLLASLPLTAAAEPQAAKPFQYIDMPIQDVARRLGVQPNRANNLVFEGAEHRVLLESNGNLVDYVDVELTSTPRCSPKDEIDSTAVLAAMGIDTSELELAIKQPDNHIYYDHKRMLKVAVSCSYESAPLTAGFSRRHYMTLTSSTQR